MSDLFEWFYGAVAWLINNICFFLPDSPFQTVSLPAEAYATWLGWLNWFCPISEVAAIMSVWLLAIGVFYGFQVVLRWVKADN